MYLYPSVKQRQPKKMNIEIQYLILQKQLKL